MSGERVVYSGFEGVTLVGDVRGDASAWPVLFLHGGGQTRQAWGGAAERIAARGWLTVSLDLRGHGESDWSPAAAYSYEAYAADCVKVAESLGRPPVFVGASLGGIAAMLAAGSSGVNVAAGLVLVDIAPEVRPEGVARVRSFMRSGVTGFDSLEEAAAAIAAYTPQRKRDVNLAGLSKVLRERDGRYYWHWDPKIITDERSETRHLGITEQLMSALSRVDVPTMLVRGMSSDVVSDEGVAALLEVLPETTIVGIDGAAHMIAGDRNDAFTEAVVTFLGDSIRPTLSA